MPYQALARKWRPRNFQEMVGQEHVLRMLINALEYQRLHHAYLFTGTRGVGKTTVARILAKCLNCEKGISALPCGQCSICQAIDTGRFLDLIEIDAASRTKVEDTREILDNVQYAPSQGRYKIYLIDEVHMLSGHSFNALLKTLEEPPAHVKFLLATTDPKRLPITILSRCLQFNLKRVPVEQIAKHLQHICHTENIRFEEPALQLLAQAADGSLRDALSILDQAIAYCREEMTTRDMQQMLGSIEQETIYRLVAALAEQDGKKLITEIAHLTESAPNFDHVLESLLTVFHQISLAQIIPDLPASNEQIKSFATAFSAEEIQLFYQIGLIGRRDLPLAPHPMHGFEMVMLRMLAFQPQETPLSPAPKTQHSPEEKIPKKETPSYPPSSLPARDETSNWADILPKLELSGIAQTLAANCNLMSMQHDKIELALAPSHEAMLNKKWIDRIEQSLARYLNKPIKLDIKIASHAIETPAKKQLETQTARQASAVEAIKNDGHVQKLVDIFNATIDINSIEAT